MNEKMSITYILPSEKSCRTECKYISFVKKQKVYDMYRKMSRMLHTKPDLGYSGEWDGRRKRTEIFLFSLSIWFDVFK